MAARSPSSSSSSWWWSWVVVLLVGIFPGRSLGTNFENDAVVMFGEGRARIKDKGNLMSLSLDKSSGSGFQSKNEFLYAKLDMKIKLVPGNSAGTVTSFYLKSGGSRWDEIDMEFLGNSSGDPYVLHTNIYVDGVGNREQQFYLWFDPTTDFHSYSILWNPAHIVLIVDQKPIREYRNVKNVPYPKAQPMKLYGSIWNADEWATRGGLVKTDWSKAPFTASFSNYDAEGCVVSSSSCDKSSGGWYSSQVVDMKEMNWVHKNYMIYTYCHDPTRFPSGSGLPAECNPNN